MHVGLRKILTPDMSSSSIGHIKSCRKVGLHYHRNSLWLCRHALEILAYNHSAAAAMAACIRKSACKPTQPTRVPRPPSHLPLLLISLWHTCQVSVSEITVKREDPTCSCMKLPKGLLMSIHIGYGHGGHPNRHCNLLVAVLLQIDDVVF